MKECINWASSHFNSTTAAAELKKLLNKPACPRKGRAGSAFTPYDPTIGRRVALISSALRCKWDKLISWSCSSCSAVPDYKLLTAHQNSRNVDPDGFIVGFDAQLNAVVLSFRSTYCSRDSCLSVQWLNNLEILAKTISLPTGTYQVHSGIHNTWEETLKTPVLQALKDAFALHPPSGHNGLYVTGHSRGGAFATLAAVELYFEAANLGLTAPTDQIKLYTMGSLRTGDANYAALIESLFTTRFRMVNNADIVTLLPPTQVKWIEDLLYLLGDFGRSLINMVSRFSFYRHYGPIVLNIDVVPDMLDKIKICPDGECPDCLTAALLTLALGRNWDDSVFTRIAIDHQWYLGIDQDNQNCIYNGRSYSTPAINE